MRSTPEPETDNVREARSAEGGLRNGRHALIGAEITLKLREQGCLEIALIGGSEYSGGRQGMTTAFCARNRLPRRAETETLYRPR